MLLLLLSSHEKFPPNITLLLTAFIIGLQAMHTTIAMMMLQISYALTFETINFINLEGQPSQLKTDAFYGMTLPRSRAPFLMLCSVTLPIA